MNEVTKIHLGRQAFTISVDAHHQLKSYLEAISKQVDDKDVLEEIEMRMAELLSEHGVDTNKVIIPSDVEFLKSQLGNPKDFKEDEEETTSSSSKQSESKRLYRDIDNAMIAGVSSGLAQYFGIDVLLIRILFVVAVLATFGWGILLYIVLWLLVPEAKTSSERLQMAGKPVNVDSLKEIVGRADVKGAASRAHDTLADPINSLFRFLLKLVGILFIVSGLSIIFGLIAGETYAFVNNNSIVQNNVSPIGFREHLLLHIASLVAALIAVFVILFGIAMFRRKWPIRNWVTGILVGILFIGLAVGGALSGNVYPNIRDRYNANTHSTVQTVAPFNALNINADDAMINFQTANTYSVGTSYYGHPDLSNLKISVHNKTLIIDGSQFNWHRNCNSICIPSTYNLSLTIYSPDADQLANQFYESPGVPDATFSPKPVLQP
ncbi:MAG TPA: PspC domain-containing protein [Candidatus Saccharimonadales bacterium]